MAMSQWWAFTENLVNTEQDSPGVYELGNSSKNVVYIGSTNAIKRRLLEHLGGSDPCINTHAKYYRVDYRPDYATEERRRYDAFVIANGRPPRCNDRRP